MYIKILCFLLVSTVVVYGRPYEYGNVDPGFSRYPNQGQVPDLGFGNGHGQGYPNQGGFVPGYPNPGAGGSHSGHRHGYQEHGY